MTSSNEVIYRLIFCRLMIFHALCKKTSELNLPCLQHGMYILFISLLIYFYLHEYLLMFCLLCLRVFAPNKDKINKYRACVTDSYSEFTVTTF